jgi:hypothetical protein
MSLVPIGGWMEDLETKGRREGRQQGADDLMEDLIDKAPWYVKRWLENVKRRMEKEGKT